LPLILSMNDGQAIGRKLVFCLFSSTYLFPCSITHGRGHRFKSCIAHQSLSTSCAIPRPGKKRALSRFLLGSGLRPPGGAYQAGENGFPGMFLRLIRSCFNLFMGQIPLPIPDFRHVLAVLVDVLLVLDELVLHPPLQRGAARAQMRKAINHILHQVKPVQIV
jgi:hypothetical protein